MVLAFWEDEYLTEERAHFDGDQVLKHKVTSRTLIFYGINSLNGWAVKKKYDVPVLNEIQLLILLIVNKLQRIIIFI